MSNAPTPTPISPTGLLLIDKPAGSTSMDVCARIRTKLRRGGAPKRVKVGHAGTLDPMATGLLVVMVGKATKLCNALMADEKEYLATIDLGHTSTTDDAEGDCTPVLVEQAPTRDTVLAAIATFVGTIQQTPPNFSAIKLGGRRAYDMARDGDTPQLAARPVVVHAIDLLSYDYPTATIRVHCGKGTYIRSIARDLGRVLGTGGMLTQLRRTRAGAWLIADAHTMESLPDALTQGDLLPLPSTTPSGPA